MKFYLNNSFIKKIIKVIVKNIKIIKNLSTIDKIKIVFVLFLFILGIIFFFQKPISQQLKEIKKINNELTQLQSKKEKLSEKLKEINRQIEKLEQEKNKKEYFLIKKLTMLKDEDYKKNIFKEILGFIPNTYLLNNLYYLAPTKKTLIQLDQYKLNWRVNSKGASKPYIKLLGKNKIERLKSLLKFYNLKNTLNTWIKVGQEYKIKPEVLVCIARADTDLGKMLKSKNNIGNVGNNNRGDVVSFPSLEKGIEAIAKTLNNRYLGGYTKIGQLSEGGRKNLGLPSCQEKGVFCYATSKENWNVNVINCLSMIYNKPVDEDFKFRISENEILSFSATY